MLSRKHLALTIVLALPAGFGCGNPSSTPGPDAGSGPDAGMGDLGRDAGVPLRRPGQRCDSDEECASGDCTREAESSDVVGGSCFQPCLDDPDCGADEICVTFGGGNSECLARCASTADCDAGRLCFPDFDREPVETYCIPHCWRDDQCLGGRCNAWSGLCEEPDLDLGGVEADCDVDADCRSDLCDPDIGCLTLCASDLAGDVCPEGAACIPFDVPGGLGECRSR